MSGAGAFPEGGLLVVNFHHVRPAPDPDFPGIHGLTRAAFEAQLDRLGESFAFATPEEVERFAQGGALEGPPRVFLTFDDGLRDHVETVLPVLAGRGIRGAFFVSTLPWAERRMLPVHGLHLLSGRYGYVELRPRFEAAARALGSAASVDAVTPEDARRQYRYDDPETARIKYFLNVALEPALRAGVVHAVFGEVLGGESAYVDRHYLTPPEARALAEAGMVVGMHTHRHVPCETLPDPELRADLAENHRILGEVLGRAPEWLSYPYGSPVTYGPRTRAVLGELGVRIAFTMRRACMRRAPDPLEIDRVDTNDAPGGKSPLDPAVLLA